MPSPRWARGGGGCVTSPGRVYLAVATFEDHSKGPMADQVLLAVLEVPHHLHRPWGGMKPGGGGAARRSRGGGRGGPSYSPSSDPHLTGGSRARSCLPPPWEGAAAVMPQAPPGPGAPTGMGRSGEKPPGAGTRLHGGGGWWPSPEAGVPVVAGGGGG